MAKNTEELSEDMQTLKSIGPELLLLEKLGDRRLDEESFEILEALDPNDPEDARLFETALIWLLRP